MERWRGNACKNENFKFTNIKQTCRNGHRYWKMIKTIMKNVIIIIIIFAPFISHRFFIKICFYKIYIIYKNVESSIFIIIIFV